MEPHAVPRQITTFEFKLIGFLTLKQFIYILFSSAIGLIIYYAIPIPFFNILFAAVIAFIGFAIAFIPYNERPLDVWIRNFIKKLFSASQYYYIKNNIPPDFFKDILIENNPNLVFNHIDAQNKLVNYLNNNPKLENKENKVKEQENTNNNPQNDQEKNQDINQPFLYGIVKNKREEKLPNILVYIKNTDNKTIRILKTNLNGYFATFHPLPFGEYFFELKDTNQQYFFDTIKIKIISSNQSINFTSKELI